MFAARFEASVTSARGIARTVLIERLPEPLVFRVRLNQSYDAHPPAPGEVRYPEDSGLERAVALHRCDAATAVAELWRDGRVPQWINVAVVDETGDETVVELVCCGRFTADEDRLYRAPTGPPPFNVGGPWLRFNPALPFSIHTHAECFDAADVRRLAAVARTVRSLELWTGDCDADLPDLPNLEILEHRVCLLGDRAMAGFARLPKLRSLRLHLRGQEDFRAGGGPLPVLDSLTVTHLPPGPWGQEQLAAPVLSTVDLHAAGVLWLDGAFPPAVRDVRLTAAEVAGDGTLPATLQRLSIHLEHGTDRAVGRLLEGVTAVESLDLSGTPVTDAIVPLLEPLDLSVLDLRRTATGDAALARFRTDRPGVRLLPGSAGPAPLQ